MATITVYREDPSEQKRRRSKWAFPLLIGLIAAYGFGRPKRPVETAPPVVVNTEVGSPEAAPPVIDPQPVLDQPPIEAPPPVPPARAVVRPERLDFGDGPMTRALGAQLATIRNDGGQPIARVTTAVEGPFLATNGCPGALAPGAECVVAVVFAPQEPGKFAGALTITTDGERSRVPLRGSVPRPREVVPPPKPAPPAVAETPPVIVPAPPKLPPPRRLCVDPPSLLFTTTGKQAITLTNPESTPLRILGVAVLGRSGQSASGYQIDARKCVRSLKPGQRCKFTVQANELALQTRERIELAVYYDDLATGQRRTAGVGRACGPAGR